MRLDAPSQGGRLTGTLVAVESDTLVVREDGQAEGLRLIILTDSIARLEVRRERSMAFEGAGVGLFAGILAALAADPNWVDENGECTTLPCVAYKVSPHLDTRLAVLGVVGTLLGAIAGSGRRRTAGCKCRCSDSRLAPRRGAGWRWGCGSPSSSGLRRNPSRRRSLHGSLLSVLEDDSGGAGLGRTRFQHDARNPHRDTLPDYQLRRIRRHALTNDLRPTADGK